MKIAALATVAGASAIVGEVAETTFRMPVGTLLTVLGTACGGAWWLRGELVKLGDKVNLLEKTISQLPCQKNGCSEKTKIIEP